MADMEPLRLPDGDGDSYGTVHYCQSIHGAIAAAHLGGDEALVRAIKVDFASAQVTPKMKSLLAVAGKVQMDGKHVQVNGKDVTTEFVAKAREEGATDLEIHDTVLIAAAFSMYNRYVDGLATMQPHGEDAYREMGVRLAEKGYVPPHSPK